MQLRIGALILLVLGVTFLLINLDVAGAAELKAFLARWWPLVLIVVAIALLMRPKRGRA